MEVNKLEKSSEQKIAMRVSVTSIVVNVMLSIFKLIAGILAKSGAMISDAIHSASDVFSTFIVIIGFKISSKESDDNHQYGHERLECIASIILAIILFITGVGIGISGVEKIINNNSENLKIPGVLALLAAIISIGVKEWMYWFTRDAAKKLNSGSLMADAWHHRSDALSSVGSFIGVLGARLGFPVLDPIASVIICFFIGKAAFDIFKDSIEKLVDKSCDNETLKEIENIIVRQNGVVRVDMIKTRLFGPKMYVDIEICADGRKPLYEAHEIAHSVHDAIEANFPMVKHCMVHVNPINIVK